MSTKENKALLKEIRESIKNEKYPEAIKKCQELIKNEPGNYMAHLLMGASYQNTDKVEAAKYLRKAVELSPPQPPTVALQGLANCACVEELPKIYEQLIELVPEKQNDYYEKLYNTSTNSKVSMDCFNVFKRINENNSGNQTILKYMGRIWVQMDAAIETADEPLFKSCLEAILTDNQLDIYLPAFKRYLKLLYKLKDISNCLKNACKLVELYPQDIYAYEWICKMYCEIYDFTSNSFKYNETLPQPIEEYATKLLNLNAESSLALLIQAIDHYNNQQFVVARDLLHKVLAVQPNYHVAVKLLANTLMHIESYGLAEDLWKQLGEEYKLEYALCLSFSGEKDKLSMALEILKEQEEKFEIVQALGRCYFGLKDAYSLKPLNADNLTKAEFLLSPSDALILLQTSTDLDADSYGYLFLIGKIYYKLQNYSDALTSILKATRLKPHSSQCFYYLGKIYFALQDIMRSRKCFEKSLTLNPLNEKAVETLSTIYQQLNEEDLNVSLLVNTLKYLKSTEKAKHIYYKLGLHYLNVGKYDETIQALRTAIKIDVSNIIYWESLGEAYAQRGSYNSAIRVFQKILEMQEDNLYAKLQVALIKTTIRMYSEAIDEFNQILQKHKDYLPALKGAAEAHVCLANNLKAEHRYGRAKDHLQYAIDMLQRLFFNPDNLNMVWLWRLTANVFVYTAQMPESLANLDVDGMLAKRDTQIAFLTRKDLLQLAAKFYTCALKIKQNTFLWYELALCSYYSADYISDEAETHIEMALQTCQMAIKEDPNRWQNWNLLGVINMHAVVNNYPMAQHCFVQALTIERKSYTSWTNLGVLYLHLREIKLANQAFQKAQQSSPIYPNAWIGQAMIAEEIAEEEEALDLFRHCQQFDFHAESSLGYAHWVCNILLNDDKCSLPQYKRSIEAMCADVVAFDAINWYTINEESNSSAAAYSFQGFLAERQKMLRPAVRAYAKAAEKASAGAQRDLMYTNLGYVYLKLSEPIEAINAFNKVTHASFKPIVGLALAYFKAGQHQESYSMYNSILKSVAGTEDDKAARILVAMASMVYAFQGEADTKTILYQCILLKDSPIQALYSACALGILHKDNQLTETILSELKKHENNEKHAAHIAYLTSQYYLANQQPRKALTYLIMRVHIFPQCSELRKVLANFLLHNYDRDQRYHVPTSRIALSAISLVHKSKTKKSNSIEDSETLLIASKALQPVNKQYSLKLIQRAILLHPQNVNAWNTLLQVH